MLIGFKVANFKSFSELQEFSFCTSSDQMHAATHCLKTGLRSVQRVAKSAVIFGPNGSGKTNLIAAIDVMRDLVLQSTTLSATEFAQRHMPHDRGSSHHNCTEFEIDLVLDKIRYRYGFAFDATGIRAEQLRVYRCNKSQRWFNRVWDYESDQEIWSPFSQSLNGPRAMWREATGSTALFLTTAVQLNAHHLRPLFNWFERGLELVHSSMPANLAQLASDIKNPRFKGKLIDFLQAAGTSVNDIRAQEVDLEPVATNELGPHSKPYRAQGALPALEFSHLRGGEGIWMRSMDESAGALRLASLFGPLLSAIEQGKFLLIDEFDLSLHPLVARYLLELINDPSLPHCGAQLLLTSHNTTLMDVQFLRRDQIWLMSLNEIGASQLAPMWHDAKPPRKHELVGKNYLRGRYGAVPKVRSDVFIETVVLASPLKAMKTK